MKNINPGKLFKQLLASMLIMAFVTLLFLAFSPLPKATHQNCEKITGQVINVFQGGGENDIVINIKNDGNYYYLNRGLEKGLDLEALQTQLTNNNITLYYVKHWSLLDLYNQTRHVARLDFNGAKIYNEMP